METTAWNSRLLVLALTVMPLGALAAEPYSPHVGQAYPDNVYWGDTHVHTALSVDGYIFGNRLMPDDAYRFAKGETIRSPGGGEVRLRRPLDFLMVSDHAENMGVIARIDAGDKSLSETEAGKLTVQSLDYPVSLAEALNADNVYWGDAARAQSPPCLQTPISLAPGSCRTTPIVSPRVRRSGRRAAGKSVCTDRRTSSWCWIMQRTSALSRGSMPETNPCWRQRPASMRSGRLPRLPGGSPKCRHHDRTPSMLLG